MKTLKFEVLLVVMVGLWGLSFSLTKPLLNKMGVFNFLTIRFLFGGLFLMLLLWLASSLKIDKALLKASVTTGILLFVAFYCHTEGLKHTTVANNAFIVGSSVIFIPLILYVKRKEKSSWLSLLQMFMAVLGLGLITLIEIGGVNKGDVITLIGTLAYAICTIKVEESVRNFNPSVFTAVQLTTVGVLSFVFMLIFETPNFNFPLSEWGVLAFMTLILTSAFYYFLNRIQQVLSAAHVTLIFTLEPFFATFFGFVFLNESITPFVVLGGGLIMLSMSLPYLVKPKDGLYES